MILVDTNAIIYYLHKVEPYASKVKEILMERRDLAITLRILDEIVFTLIRLEALRRFKIRKLADLKNYISIHGLSVFSDVINDVEELVDKLGIVVLEDRGSFKELLDTVMRYNLLPGDALIALTAKYYNIDTILTFDENFKRVPWLKVIP